MTLQSTDKKGKEALGKRGSSESSRFHTLFYEQFLHPFQSHPLNIYASCSSTVSPHNLSSPPVLYNKLKSQTKEIDLDNQSVVYNAPIMLSYSTHAPLMHPSHKKGIIKPCTSPLSYSSLPIRKKTPPKSKQCYASNL